jgi:hypothetical protein
LTGTNSTNRGSIDQNITASLVEGRTYRFQFDVSGWTGGTQPAGVGISLGGSNRASVSITGDGHYSVDFLRATGTDRVWFRTATTGGDYRIDNVSVREVL